MPIHTLEFLKLKINSEKFNQEMYLKYNRILTIKKKHAYLKNLYSFQIACGII